MACKEKNMQSRNIFIASEPLTSAVFGTQTTFTSFNKSKEDALLMGFVSD